MLKPYKNKYIVKPIVSDNPFNLMGWNGIPITVSARFDKFNHGLNFVEIIETPIVDDGKHTIYPVGKKCLVDYIVCLDKNKLTHEGEEYYMCGTEFVWGTVNDGNTEIIPDKKFILCQKVYDTELEQSGIIIKLNEEQIRQILIVHTGEDYKKGEIIYMMNGKGLPIPDSDLVLVYKKTILAYFVDGKLEVVKGRHLIAEDETPDFNYWKGLMVSSKQVHPFRTGIYITGDNPQYIGKKISYIHSMFTDLVVNDVKYACVTNGELIFVEQ
jgi:hypothetical protein